VTAQIEKLAAAGIQLLPAEITSHFIFQRDGFVAFVERRENLIDDRREEGFGNIGAPGLLTEHGFQAFFIAKGFEQAASDGQVRAIRAFAADLASALRL